MVANLLFFGGAALLLMAVGLWGLRRAKGLSAVEGWDEASKEHRRGVLRRGSYTCLGLGALFLAITMASLFLSPTTPIPPTR